MKLFGAAMVRNEADIIEAFVRHNLTALDGLAIVDHGSFDGTSQILAALVEEGLPLVVGRNESLGHHQAQISTQAVREILARTPADFVFALDADEFLKAPSRPLLERALQAVPPGMHAIVEWQTYVPDFAAAGAGTDVRTCIAGAKRLVQERHGLHKVVVGRHFAQTPDAMIAMGHHQVVPSAAGIVPGRSNPHAKLARDAVALAHVPVRSRDQFTAKIAIGWLASLAAGNDPQSGFHWREIFADLMAGQELSAARLTEIAANYSLHQSDWQAPETIARLDDPFLADFELRYSHLGRGEPLSLVLEFAEKLVAGS